MLAGRNYRAKFVMQNAAVAVANGTAIDVCQGDNGGHEWLAIQIVGITTATITFEGTIDGTNWVAVQFTSLASGTAATTATADGIYQARVAGLVQVRARISAWTAGTITATAGLLS